MTMKYRVFISYATQDLQLADYLSFAIRKQYHHADVFIAKYCVPPGPDLAFSIYTALINADTVVLLWTPVSQLSNWVKSEGEYSFVLGKHLIQIKTERDIPISRTLRTLKYESAYSYPTVKACLDHTADHVAYLARNLRLSHQLISEARRSLYSLTQDDDAFYKFAIGVLKKHNTDTLFISGSPVAVLPFETSTNARKEYLLRMHSYFTRRSAHGIARYVFNKKRTFHRIASSPSEADALPNHLHFMQPLLESNNFNLLSSQSLDFVPSGLVTPTEGAIVLKDPSEPDRTVGVYFVKGEQLKKVVRALRYITRPPYVEPESVWLPQITDLCAKIGKSKHTPPPNPSLMHFD